MNILLLGATGSIGTSTCNCVRRNPGRFTLAGVSAHRQTETLASIIDEFGPGDVCVSDDAAAAAFDSSLARDVRLRRGKEGLEKLANETDYDILVNALVGAAGFRPTLAALGRGKRVALANKESLVIGGDLIRATVRRTGAELIPVDSEHSAILQCLAGERREDIESIVLTASGGPFREISPENLRKVTPAQALDHPTWSMGAKITIDSATLVNKGFELIEAHHLFNLPYEKLRVCIHPQSIVHSMVEFHDGAVMAQLGVPDMELPIQYALSYPNRLPLHGKRLHLPEIANLSFYEPDMNHFPCLGLCIEAGRMGGTAPVVLNAANEIAVGLFLKEKIGFPDISRIIDQELDGHTAGPAEDTTIIEEIDNQTRNRILSLYS